MDEFLDLATLNEMYGYPTDTPPDFEANDWDGVHINSGIPNRACFLIAEAIGREKTEQIYFRILATNLLISQARFIDMRLAAQQSAIDLFGEGSAEEEAVLAAFDSVGILDEEATTAPEDVQPVDGDEWIVVVNAEQKDTSLLMTRPVVESEDDFRWLTFTQVSIESGSPVSALDDGSYLLFIDAENFIRGIFTDGTGEEVLSETGEWGSLALSPDGSKLAATTAYEDTAIFVFDLVDPDNFKAIHLYNPTTQEGLTADVTRFADALAWDLSSQYLVYDAFNSVPLADDNTVGFWNVSVLNVETESISP